MIRIEICGRSCYKYKLQNNTIRTKAVMLILLYRCTTWTLTKRMEKKLDSNYTRMLRAIMNKSWRQHPTKQQLYGHLPPITKTIKVRQTRHAQPRIRSSQVFWDTNRSRNLSQMTRPTDSQQNKENLTNIGLYNPNRPQSKIKRMWKER